MSVRKKDAPTYDDWLTAGEHCYAIHEVLVALHMQLANHCLTFDDALLRRLDRLQNDFNELRSDLDNVCYRDAKNRDLWPSDDAETFPIYPSKTA